MATTYAYRSFYGKRRDGTIVQGIIPQFDGSTYAATNCGPCAESMRLVSQRKGVRPSKGTPWFPTGASIRRETGDTSGGTNPGQTTRASYAEYGVSFAAPRIGTFAEVLDKLDNGYAVDLLVGYGPIDEYKSGSPGFEGGHRILLVGRSVTSTGKRLLDADPLYDGRRAGIPYGQQWMPQSVILTAAGQLKADGTHTLDSSHGPGRAYYIPSLTRIEAPKRYRAVVVAQGLWFYTVANGYITGRVARRTGGFSGTCTAPAWYRWPGVGSYHLVKMTSGAYAGRYIAARFARVV